MKNVQKEKKNSGGRGVRLSLDEKIKRAKEEVDTRKKALEKAQEKYDNATRKYEDLIQERDNPAIKKQRDEAREKINVIIEKMPIEKLDEFIQNLTKETL